LTRTTVFEKEVPFDVCQDLVRLTTHTRRYFVHNPFGVAYDYCAEIIGVGRL